MGVDLHKPAMRLQPLRRLIQMHVGKSPVIFSLAYRLLGKQKKLAVRPDTEIVIEGFPRSGNSFAVLAFEVSQATPVKIAHHLHAPAQVIRAAKFKIPCVVLIRNPIDAVSSLVVRESCISIDAALREYICFYGHIDPFRQHFVLAVFENVISDYGTVVAMVNQQFGTDFEIFQHSAENVQKIFGMLDGLEYIKKQEKVDETKVARPSDRRKAEIKKVQQEIGLNRYHAQLRRAEKLYEQFIASSPSC